MALRSNPRPPGCVKLKGRDGWRIRAGEYRVIYEISDADRTVVIHYVAHRKEVYR
jgi:mRNA interferase RelE/StbE